DEMSNREKKAVDDDFEFWGGVDLGVNGLMTYDNQVVMPQGLESMDLNYVKSYVFGVNMFQKNIHIYRNNVNLGTGLGLTWYHYNLRGSYSLQPNVDYTFAVNDSLDYSKNRLNMCYVNVPLFLEFNTNSSNADRSFHIGGGVQFGYNIFKNKLKQKYELDNRTYKRKVKDDFNINPFKIDLIGRMGFGDFTIFASYSLTTLFEKQKGPTLYPFTAGIHIDF
ncbi:MAG TPA: outer membrane beta-barrel protein, partial [Bacteroidia bacterium]|nr:outer membrane beta-barrel protein [Bacteroidia bacterium]